MRCMYTNTDSLLNKRSELDVVISVIDPDIIAITETLQKNRDIKP